MNREDVESLVQEHELDHCWAPGTDLSKKSTLGVGVKTDRYFYPEDLEDLHRVRHVARKMDRECIVVGGGSNLLFTENARQHVLVELTGDPFVETRLDEQHGRFRLEVGAGKQLPPLVRNAVEEGWVTLGRLTGIPGTVGGALYGNSGTRDGAIGDFVREVFVLHPVRPDSVNVGRPNFGYRWSNIQGQIILGAVLEGENLEEDLEHPPHERIQESRQKSQPISERSAGCMFKNPENESAGKLIDDAGLKGHRIGDARVSDVHANFVVNEGGATAEDVLQLIEEVRETVQDQYGVQIEREIQII